MSFAVRDWMTYRFQAAPRQEADARDVILDAVRLALQDATLRARADFPQEFTRVDAITRDPYRIPKVVQAFNYEGRVSECRWCGADFPARTRTYAYCTDECREAHLRFRRARRESA